MNILKYLCAWGLVCLMNTPLYAEISPEDAKSIVENVGSKGVNIATSGKPLERKRTELLDLMDSKIDKEAISSFVLGQYWRQFSDNEKQELFSILGQWLIGGYTDLFNKYKEGIVFSINESNWYTKKAAGSYIIRSTLVHKGQNIVVDWTVTSTGKIMTLRVEGIDWIQAKRDEANEIKKNKTPAEFIKSIKESIHFK